MRALAGTSPHHSAPAASMGCSPRAPACGSSSFSCPVSPCAPVASVTVEDGGQELFWHPQVGVYRWSLAVTVLPRLQASLACLSPRVAAGSRTESALGGEGSAQRGHPAVPSSAADSDTHKGRPRGHLTLLPSVRPSARHRAPPTPFLPLDWSPPGGSRGPAEAAPLGRPGGAGGLGSRRGTCRRHLHRDQGGHRGPVCSRRVQRTHRSPRRQAGLCAHHASSPEDSPGPICVGSFRGSRESPPHALCLSAALSGYQKGTAG